MSQVCDRVVGGDIVEIDLTAGEVTERSIIFARSERFLGSWQGLW